MLCWREDKSFVGILCLEIRGRTETSKVHESRKFCVLTRTASPRASTGSLPPRDVELEHPVEVGPPGAEAQAVIIVFENFVRFKRLRIILQLLSRVEVSPDTFCHFCVLWPVRPWLSSDGGFDIIVSLDSCGF